MKKYEKQITVSEEFYEISKEELEKIKKAERVRGRVELADYILFCYSNYIFKINVGGVFEFLKEVLDFLARKKDKISNKYEIGFFDYAKEKEQFQEGIKD